MKKFLIGAFLTFIVNIACSQGLIIKVGDQFPDIPITNLINSNEKLIWPGNPGNKFYILNNWGTWCSPCLPEMDTLSELQILNPNTIQVIAISNDTPEKLKNYLKLTPTKILLASDTASFLYSLFSLAHVGQSIIINPNGKVIALVKTHSINQEMIDEILRNGTVKSNGEIWEKVSIVNDDIFGLDSTSDHSFTIKGYLIGQPSSSKLYPNDKNFANRRISFTNITISTLFKTAYGIVSEKQLIYEIPEAEVSNFENKSTLYSVDLLVKIEEKDRLMEILQNNLKFLLPIKVRIEHHEMPVYSLVNKNFNIANSIKSETKYSYSGNGFNGEAVELKQFAEDYLTNEFSMPVVDETGLFGKYDIKINVDMRTEKSLLKSLNDVGLSLIKKNKVMKVLVFYR